MADVSARQRKHAHMTSSIFDEGGPSATSLYAPGRQKELYESVKTTLGSANRGKAPDLSMPKAVDIKTTQMAGHAGAIIPGDSPLELAQPSRARITGPDILIYDGEVHNVVHSAAKDTAAIPKEFWATSVQLSWHDPRNEHCRDRERIQQRQNMGSKELHRMEMSSEMFGKERLLEANHDEYRHEVLADTTDFLRVGSASQARRGAIARQQASDEPGAARSRLHENLASSANNTMKAGQAPGSAPPPVQDEDRESIARRRQDRNYSDLFGRPTGEPQKLTARQDICSFTSMSWLDPRTEISLRNKEFRQATPKEEPSSQLPQQRSSSIFGLVAPKRPEMAPEEEQLRQTERCRWESTNAMALTCEVARRRAMKSHLTDFQGEEGQTHRSRMQGNMSSQQVRTNLNASSTVHPSSPAPARGLGQGSLTIADREEALKCSKATKQATLQSSIFS